MNKYLLPLLCLPLAGCASKEEKLCKAQIEASLINPETARFSDYRDLTSKEIQASEYWSYLPETMRHVIPKAGASYVTLKVRAEGKLGNVITSHRFCGVNAQKTDCFCVDAG